MYEFKACVSMNDFKVTYITFKLYAHTFLFIMFRKNVRAFFSKICTLLKSYLFKHTISIVEVCGNCVFLKTSDFSSLWLWVWFHVIPKLINGCYTVWYLYCGGIQLTYLNIILLILNSFCLSWNFFCFSDVLLCFRLWNVQKCFEFKSN